MGFVYTPSPTLGALGWRDDLPAATALPSLPPGRLARVAAQHRSGYRVTTGGEEFPVQSPAPWLRRNIDPERRAAVGDWVWLAPEEDTILECLPRQSLLRRGAAGEHYGRQLIAANVDTVLVVAGLDGDFNPRRLERYLLLTRDSGAQTVFVLTKADLCEDVNARLAQLTGFSEQAVPVVTLNARDLASTTALAPWVGLGQTVVLVGSSGAGKSTLTNRLLGIERQKTAEVRETDSRGRHTTTHRSLIALPGGACLIDTPGMRELKPTGEEDLAEGGFEDIVALAEQCRFRDCVHQAEPGCAVRQALDSGDLDAARLGNYLKLSAELAVANEVIVQRARRAEQPAGRRVVRRDGDARPGRR